MGSRRDVYETLACDVRKVFKRRCADIDAVNAVHNPVDRANALTAFVRDVVDNMGFAHVDGRLMYYDNGLYAPIDRNEVMSVFKAALLDCGAQPMDVRKTGSLPFVSIDSRRADSSPSLVCFGNSVIVDMATGKRVRANSNNFVTKYLEVPWHDNVPTPRWDAFLQQVLPDESVRMVLQEFFGMCFIDRRQLSIEKFLIMTGTGANGKSVVFDVIKGVLGTGNVSFLDPQQLTDPKQLAFVDGKMVNFSPDVKVGAAFDSALKSLSSSQEVNAWQLFRGSVALRCPPLVFAMNAMPRFLDNSGAFFRRLIIIRFGVTIKPKDQDRRLAARIVRDEAPGVLQWMIEGARRLVQNQGMFTESEEIRHAVDSVQGRALDDADLVADWMMRNRWGIRASYLNQPPVAMSCTEIRKDIGGRLSAARIDFNMAQLGAMSYIEGNDKYYYLYQYEN